MKTIKILTLTVFLTLAGCVTIAVPTGISGEIPSGSQVVIIESAQPQNALYTSIYAVLGRAGFGFEDTNAEMGSITTGYYEVEGDALVKISVFVESTETGSLAFFRGKWSAGSFTTMLTGVEIKGETAFWGNKIAKTTAAFAKVAEIAASVPHESLRFE